MSTVFSVAIISYVLFYVKIKFIMKYLTLVRESRWMNILNVDIFHVELFI